MRPEMWFIGLGAAAFIVVLRLLAVKGWRWTR